MSYGGAHVIDASRVTRPYNRDRRSTASDRRGRSSWERRLKHQHDSHEDSYSDGDGCGDNINEPECGIDNDIDNGLTHRQASLAKLTAAMLPVIMEQSCGNR